MNNSYCLKFIFFLTLLYLPSLDSDILASEKISDKQRLNVQKETTEKAKELWAILDDVYTKMQSRLKENSANDTISGVLEQKCDISWNNQYQVKALLAEADNLEANKGLSIRGGYTSRDLNNIDNNNDASSYMELSWDVLRSGYKDYNSQAEKIRRQAEITKLEGELKQLTLDYRCRRHNLVQQFAGIESSLLTLKLELMEPVYQIEKKAYFSGWSFLDELLISEEDIRLARQQLEYLNNNLYLHDSLPYNVNPPVIDVDLRLIIEKIQNNQRYSKISNLEKKNITLQKSYQNGSRFRLFLRKEFASSNFNNEGLVAGLRFSTPLSLSDNKSNYYKTRQIEEQASYAIWERVTKTRSAYEQLHEQLDRVMKQQYRYLRSHERIRRIKARQSLNQELELAAVIARMRTFLDAGIELIKAKKKLYLRVNEMFLVAGIDYNDRYIKVSPLKTTDYRARNGDRSIYIWSKRFNAMSNSQILSFLFTKNIKRVLLSAGKNTDREKMKKFISMSKKENIVVETIIGSNNWLYPGNHIKASAAFAAAVEFNSRIHLDIEPQALPGDKQEKLSNLHHYIDLLNSIREISEDNYISVAVPFHWPDESYKHISQLTDKLYIMAYGTSNTDTIIRRVSRVLNNVSLSKVSVVLRVKDFENEWMMEQAIEKIQKSLGINTFTFHQLDSFIKQHNH